MSSVFKAALLTVTVPSEPLTTVPSLDTVVSPRAAKIAASVSSCVVAGVAASAL